MSRAGLLLFTSPQSQTRGGAPGCNSDIGDSGKPRERMTGAPERANSFPDSGGSVRAVSAPSICSLSDGGLQLCSDLPLSCPALILTLCPYCSVLSLSIYPALSIKHINSFQNNSAALVEANLPNNFSRHGYTRKILRNAQPKKAFVKMRP